MQVENLNLPRPLLDYYGRIGAEVLNFRRAMIKLHAGKYYLEKALIKVGPDGEISCNKKEYEPTEDEQKAIKASWAEGNMPRSIPATLAAAEKKAGDLVGQTFLFRTRVPGAAGEIVMIQQRSVNEETGERYFVPWTFWSDGAWRPMEPDGPLPFWKPAVSTSNRIMIHEGAKAAREASRIAQEFNEHGKSKHPWAEELATYEHWGMIGGALAPHRSDYSELVRHSPTVVVYVCDNDFPGESALTDVSKCWGRKLKGLKFDPRWPTSFDMADDFPQSFFENNRYIGPALDDLLVPATYATEVLHTGEKGRPSTIVKREFAEEWFHTVQPEAFAHKDWPNEILTLTEFNSKVRPFSGINDTAMLLKTVDATKGSALTYTPSKPPGIFVEDGRRCLNTHVPSRVRAEAGDVRPFLEYMEHLVPNDEDRRNLLKWVVTLVARPEVKVSFGVLLISDMQGVGKSTLGEKILKPLLGHDNVSMPGENEIVESDFNYWAAHKRLAVVHEIYAGNSSKPYNKLKSLITDDYVVINKKYQAAYQIENWIHILACSNSLNALKLSVDDRRWFVPKVTETRKPQAFWSDLNYWLQFDGGLAKIKGWCEKQTDVFFKGETAPFSEAKKEVIEEGFSPGMKFVADLLRDLKEDHPDEEMYVVDLDLHHALKEVFYAGREQGRLEKVMTLRKVAKSVGWFVREEKVMARTWEGIGVRGAKVISTTPLVEQESWSSLAQKKPVSTVELATKRVRFA